MLLCLIVVCDISDCGSRLEFPPQLCRQKKLPLPCVHCVIHHHSIFHTTCLKKRESREANYFKWKQWNNMIWLWNIYWIILIWKTKTWQSLKENNSRQKRKDLKSMYVPINFISDLPNRMMAFWVIGHMERHCISSYLLTMIPQYLQEQNCLFHLGINMLC